ncbi:surface antigen-like protein [Sphingobacterium paludis]|uniref:Surface antigen-like protein n=2 Tax=Sphingobacterium paludis TaxID=1476465 RepID=A0A4R7DBC6_9SPHI|nr:surface antigen-like protein [Sphingobacterium paludis]
MAHAQMPDSVIADIAPEYDKVGVVHRFWLGDSYRKLYNTPVTMRYVNLATEHGGLSVVKLGGGMQTQSLRLQDAQGREWVLRSIQKYPERSLPESLRKTIAKDIVQDQISIAHPFGALTVPTFNRALQIPHASPELVFVGDDERLGEYRSIFKNRPYMLEPRMPFEDSKTDNTAKVIRKVLEDNDTQIDQTLTLRARLLDFVLGDWDRHEDNWRWDPEKEKGKKIYTPVPRDRDKVYYKTSGVFPTLLSRQWLKAHLQPFSPHIRNVSHWNFNARHFDRFFLNHLSRQQWEKEIVRFQETLTDSLIHVAMLQMPDTIVALSAGEIEHFVQSRRDELLQTGTDYYRALARTVDIPLSAKSEFVEVDFEKDGSISIDVHNKKKDGSQGRRIFKRKFYADETQEIRIYGISGEDEYRLKGSGTSKIKVRLIGGDQFDQFSSSKAYSKRNKVHLYDSKAPAANHFSLTQPVRYHLRNDSSVHTYPYDNFVYDRKGVVVDFNYGVDRGLILGVGYLIENQGFRKSPYAYRHLIKANYLTGRQSFIFDYQGEFKKLIADHDLSIHLRSLGPFNQNNFFGYGNESSFDKSDDRSISYYRNRYDLATLQVLLENPLSDHIKLLYGLSSELYSSREAANRGRFFEDFHAQFPTEPVYGTMFFTGVSAGVEIDTRDNKANAKQGYQVRSHLTWQSEIAGERRHYARFSNTVNVYKTIFHDYLTVANRTGVEAVFGNPYFYQHATIGGENSLRGYNSRRFAGKTALYNNFETRLKLFSFNSYLVPGTVGAIGFYDIGRVWMSGEQSDRWHMGYGGGLYFLPGDLLVLQAAVGVSKEAVLPYIRLGLSF